jgi:hypothetical protein
MLNQAVTAAGLAGEQEGLTPDEIAKEVAPKKWNLEWSRLFCQVEAASTMDTTKKSGSGTTTT